MTEITHKSPIISSIEKCNRDRFELVVRDNYNNKYQLVILAPEALELAKHWEEVKRFLQDKATGR